MVSIGEKKVLNYIQNELANENVKNRAEIFKWKDSHSIKPIFFTFNCVFVTLFIINLLFQFYLFKIILISLIFGLYFLLFYLPKGKDKEARNLIGEINAKHALFKRPLFLFIAFYGSTFKRIKPFFMRIIQSLVLFLSFFYMIFTITAYILRLFEISTIIIVIELFILQFIEILLITAIFNPERDDSRMFPNHLSGAAVLIEIAKILKKDALNNIDVIFLWCGGKINSKSGLKSFLKRHVLNFYQEYELDRSYFLNICKIGEDLGLLKGSRLIKQNDFNKLDDIIEAISKNMNFPLIKQKKIFSDKTSDEIICSIMKKLKKFPQISTLSSLKKKHFNLTEEKLKYEEQLNNCVRLCLSVLESLDIRIK